MSHDVKANIWQPVNNISMYSISLRQPPHPTTHPPVLMESCGKIISPKTFLEFHKQPKSGVVELNRHTHREDFIWEESVNNIFSHQFGLPDTQDYARQSILMESGVPLTC